jgi:AraC-like DNA-binding protein
MITNQRQASGGLRDVVRSFAERRAQLGTSVVTAPLPARSDQFIEFYLQDRYRVSHDDGPTDAAPEMVVVGPQSYRRTRLTLSGSIHAFTIRFQPGGFYTLFGTSMTMLVNEGIAAEHVIGADAAALRDAVLFAHSFEERVAAAEHWLGRKREATCGTDEIGLLAAALLQSGGRLAVGALAQRAELSDRQFTRRFERQVGLTPKLFGRTVRLNAVLDAKARSPAAAWTDLVYDAGYSDQAHFVRDCRALAGSPPTAFFDEWAPGR